MVIKKDSVNMDRTLKVLEMFLFSCARSSFDCDTDTFRQGVGLGVNFLHFHLFFSQNEVIFGIGR
jgi:hypothetical protein